VGFFYLLWIDKVPTSDVVMLSLKRVSEFYLPRNQKYRLFLSYI
jgi:hypothetical protein